MENNNKNYGQNNTKITQSLLWHKNKNIISNSSTGKWIICDKSIKWNTTYHYKGIN